MTETAQYLNFIENPQTSIALVTGANGAVSSHVINLLLNSGCKVIAVDTPLLRDAANLQEFLSHKSFSYFQISLKKENWEIKEKLDYIFHLFDLEFIYRYEDDFNLLFKTPALTEKLLNLAQENEAKFLYGANLNIFDRLILPKINTETLLNEKKFKSSALEELEKHNQALVSSYYKKFKLNCRVVKLLDIFGPRMNLKGEAILDKLFLQATTDKILTVEGDGLNHLYPTFVTDAAEGILKAMFGYQTQGLIFNLVNPHSVNVLTFARELEKKLNGEGRVLMVKEEDVEIWQKKPKSSAKDLGWIPKVGLEEGIEKTLKFFAQKPALEKIAENVSDNVSLVSFPAQNSPSSQLSSFSMQKLTFSKKKLVFFLTVLLVLLLALLPAIFIVWGARSARNNLKLLEKQASTQKINAVPQTLNNLSGDLAKIDRGLSLYSPAFTFLGKKTNYQETQKILRLGREGVTAALSLVAAGKDFNEVTKTVLSQDQEGGVSLKIIEVKKNLDDANNRLSYIQSQLGAIRPEDSFLKGRVSPQKIDQSLSEFLKTRLLVSRARELIDVLPEVIGLTGKRSYLVLFANNMEQRPGGGFLGSYGILTFDKGKMVELKVEDIYSADGQLTGHVDPPLPIRDYLEQPHWYLRDSNWSPDFLISAQKAEWFLEKEIGRKTDGVLQVDLNGIADLINIVGPINLPDYQETITGKNLFEKATFHSQENFFPGSTQKKDFLGALSRRLLDKLLLEGTQNGQKLFTSLLTSIEKKHVVFYFNNEAIQNLISRFNWGGRIAGDTCNEEKDCVPDYLMVVDANLGVNKANVAVAKRVSQQIVFENSTINKIVSLVYQNNNSVDSFQKGRYKNYLRVYQPLNTELESIVIDSQEREVVSTISATIKNSTRAPLLVDRSIEEGKNSFGFLTEIAPGAKMNIILKFKTYNTSFDQNKYYRLVWQKQLGSQEEEYNLELTPPQGFKPDRLVEGAVIKENKIILQQNLDKDRAFNFKFVPL